jgi:hypothetical protein
MTPTLSILICHLPEREAQLADLVFELGCQAAEHPGQVQIIIDADPGSTGDKRNRLISKATGEYVCFVDDDDQVSDDYCAQILNALESHPDCASIQGQIYIDGEFRGIFEHSIRHTEWKDLPDGMVKYLRNPNHLNPVRKALLPVNPFPSITVGEDRAYSKVIGPLLKTEGECGCIYKYLASTHK